MVNCGKVCQAAQPTMLSARFESDGGTITVSRWGLGRGQPLC